MHKTKGNFNSQIGLPLTILEMKRNTEFLILEMGMSEKDVVLLKGSRGIALEEIVQKWM